ncbi:MAG TPA: hypothetical protein PKX51_20305, partial [Cyclobacteriaceae bacterium]|nr:hypothetical protein [Cyclobacteriaceae bacterium]
PDIDLPCPPLKILPDAGDCPQGVRTSQAVFYALAFFWLDGFAVPARAQVTQTVGRLVFSINTICNNRQGRFNAKWRLP